jgi:heme/copper-type cytochrome/quinol oxidase subunit 2
MELLLLFPAALFMAALVVRNLQPLQLEPAHSAERLVQWYSARMWTLWVLLLALPFTALLTGCAVLFRSRNRDSEPPSAAGQSPDRTGGRLATLLLSGTTLIAGVILAIVVLHMAAN